MTYALFGKAADQYDWHTPPHHYQDDHAFVLSKFPEKGCRILDVGCGTGVFLERAVNAGIDAIGIDASPEMISIAEKRVDSDRLRVARMQELREVETYDGIVSLSWSFNYLKSFVEATDVLSRFFKALKSGGHLVLQIAHAPNATGTLNEDREPGPDGQPDDVLFLYRFSQVRDRPGEMRAQYVYGSKSRSELLSEEHKLNAADANEVAARATDVGFNGVELLDSWRGGPMASSVSVFLLAQRP
jgi:ubiquinone/menaquinone biosynthesis C-methylase UbiE